MLLTESDPEKLESIIVSQSKLESKQVLTEDALWD